jgi:hypothetical protein
LPSLALRHVFPQHSPSDVQTSPPGRQLPIFLHVPLHTFEQQSAFPVQAVFSTLQRPPMSLHMPPTQAVEQQSRAVAQS